MKYPSVLKAYNLYRLLGLENYASGEQIKKRYWRLARKYHPDLTDSTDKEKQHFVLSPAAYNFLRDEQHHSYEQHLKRNEAIQIRFKGGGAVISCWVDEWIFTH